MIARVRCVGGKKLRLMSVEVLLLPVFWPSLMSYELHDGSQCYV